MEDLKNSSEEQNIVLSNGYKIIVEPHEEMLKRDEETSLSAGAPEFHGSLTHLPSAQSDQVSEGAVGVTAELKR